MRRFLTTALVSLVVMSGFTALPPTALAEGSRHDLVQRLKERDSWGRQSKAIRHSIIVCKWIAEHRFDWNEYQWRALKELWSKESGWRWWAPGGIPQFRPESKTRTPHNPVGQCRQGDSYIVGRYRTPRGALGHFRSHNWY